MLRSRSMLPTSAYWSEAGLGIMLFSFFVVGWTFQPCRKDLLLGKCFERRGGRWAHSCTFSVGIRTCQTCQSASWCLVLIMGVYTVFDVFGSLFISSISLGLCVKSFFSSALLKRCCFHFTSCLTSSFVSFKLMSFLAC